mmetsp:Transcript_3338/g.7655  ORF Transcript_3338/g.7655 Transcript_3338/m.7655 type:complete len:413 (+) Transcript_3338:160-1398(+)
MKVLIVGAGLSGLSTAIGIADKIKDATITIVERRPDFEARGATFGLAPNGQKALHEIAPDVLTTLKAEGILMSASGGYMLPWYRVRDALLSKVQRISDRIELRMGVSIEGVVQKEDKMLVASFEDSSLTFEADMIIGADGVHSYVRTDILRLPPAVSTGAHVWRGSLNINGIDGLKHFEEYGIAKNNQFGDKMIMMYFNFHAKTPGLFAWVFSVQDPSEELGIKSGVTTPLDMIQSYMESQSSPDEKLLKQFVDAKLVLENIHSLSDLMWSTQMAVVDLTAEAGWGGKGRITLVGDAAHSIRPASGLGGSLAFEDATLLSRILSEDDEVGADIASRLRDFEGKRLPRCKSISRDQTLRSTLSYKLGYNEIPPWDQRYKEWVFDGLAAAPTPPISEEAVFANVLASEQSALAQ